jgi:hypothetical protein
LPSSSEDRELVNGIFSAALVMLAIFLGFVGVLAAVHPEVERISYLHNRFLVSVWASMIGVLLSGGVSGASLAYLTGRRTIPKEWIIRSVYLLIGTVVVATLSLVWAIGL